MIRKMYAEDFNETIEEHRKTCKDPKCDETFVQKFPGLVRVMVKTWVPDELFLTENGEPFMSIPVAGDEIRKMLNKNGKLDNSCGHETEEAFLQSCDHKEVGFRVLPNNQIVLECVHKEGNKWCSNWIIKVTVAPRPKIEMPYIFCDVHGKQLSYFTCKHVMQGKEPMILQRATADVAGATGIGTALCSDKCVRITHNKRLYKKHEHEFRVVCTGHLNDLLNGKLEQFLKEVEAIA